VVKPLKLYESLLQNPGQMVAFRDLEALLNAFGFVHLRTRGSHRSYKHPRVEEVLTVQPKGKDAAPYQVRRFLAIVREYDLKPDD
jgi:predicted RNA binding protein YcfA (HicA-like mRNA interferase family)